MKTVRQLAIAAAALGLAAMLSTSGAEAKAKGACIRAGGSGIGALQGFASFMANAAMKNSAKAFGGDSVKIGKVTEACTQEGLGWKCKATAPACK